MLFSRYVREEYWSSPPPDYISWYFCFRRVVSLCNNNTSEYLGNGRSYFEGCVLYFGLSFLNFPFQGCSSVIGLTSRGQSSYMSSMRRSLKSATPHLEFMRRFLALYCLWWLRLYWRAFHEARRGVWEPPGQLVWPTRQTRTRGSTGLRREGPHG